MRVGRFLIAACILILSSAVSRADNFSFTGNLNDVNDVQYFTFTVAAGETAVLQSYSYAGGVNSDGQTILRGGFDPSIFIFQGVGPSAVYAGQNGDGDPGTVGVDPVTGCGCDVYLDISYLGPGIYTAALTDFDNSPVGLTLGEGFNNGGLPGADFPDFFGTSRDSHWALDILGAESAVADSPVPEPGTLALLGTGLIGMAGMVRRRLFNN